MNPPITEPPTGPRKGEAEKIIIGKSISDGSNKSTTEPAATARKALPAKPSKNRPTITVARFWATASGISQMTNMAIDPR